MNTYDTAQVCPNGHVANPGTQKHSDWNRAFCETCGEKTLTVRSQCNTSIRGLLKDSGVLLDFETYAPPLFCYNCGAEFPWTQRATQAAIELAAESGELDAGEQQQFTESIYGVVKNTPRMQVAALRIVKILGKLRQPTINAIQTVLNGVLSEAAKRAIWPR
jgi:hypothetical protein